AQPPDPAKGSLPLAARCAGGGPGCAEQPLIPPPAGGLPHFDPPPPPVFGALVAVAPAAAPSLNPSPPPALEHPPQLALAA
ncbi:MAG TPA: stress protein, partial [Dehalococcoidia bacterium]|nr:stress protein [Dehalococcoidia bacterium]